VSVPKLDLPLFWFVRPSPYSISRRGEQSAQKGGNGVVSRITCPFVPEQRASQSLCLLKQFTDGAEPVEGEILFIYSRRCLIGREEAVVL
ncbi:hypothetical protein BaRGS_00009512, partial [Batillaria attramentaria]